MAKKKVEKEPVKPELTGFLLEYAQKLKADRKLQYLLFEFIQLALKIDRQDAIEVANNMERPE